MAGAQFAHCTVCIIDCQVEIMDTPPGTPTVVDTPPGTLTVVDTPPGTPTVVDTPPETLTVVDNCRFSLSP